MRMTPTALTSSLKKMIDRDVENAGDNPARLMKLFDHYEGGIEHYRKQFESVSEPMSRAHAVHQHVDRAIDDLKKNHPGAWAEVKCKAGCAHCCFNPVVINEEEAHLLLEFAKEKKIEIDWERARKQLAYDGKSDHEYFLQPKQDGKCVFLDDQNLCKVYEHRPASCRKYLVGSPPESCDDRQGSQQVMVLSDLQAELAVSGFMDIDHSKVGLLPKMLFQAQMNRPAHCNYCQKETETKEWDCIACGLSKGHPHANPNS